MARQKPAANGGCRLNFLNETVLNNHRMFSAIPAAIQNGRMPYAPTNRGVLTVAARGVRPHPCLYRCRYRIKPADRFDVRRRRI